MQATATEASFLAKRRSLAAEEPPHFFQRLPHSHQLASPQRSAILSAAKDLHFLTQPRTPGAPFMTQSHRGMGGRPIPSPSHKHPHQKSVILSEGGASAAVEGPAVGLSPCYPPNHGRDSQTKPHGLCRRSHNSPRPSHRSKLCQLHRPLHPPRRTGAD